MNELYKVLTVYPQMTKLISLENIGKNDNHSVFILRSQNSNKHLMYGPPSWFWGLIIGKFNA